MSLMTEAEAALLDAEDYPPAPPWYHRLIGWLAVLNVGLWLYWWLR